MRVEDVLKTHIGYVVLTGCPVLRRWQQLTFHGDVSQDIYECEWDIYGYWWVILDTSFIDFASAFVKWQPEPCRLIPVVFVLVYFCVIVNIYSAELEGWGWVMKVTSFVTNAPCPWKVWVYFIVVQLSSLYFPSAKRLPKSEPQAAGANSGRNRGVDLTEAAQPAKAPCCSN